MTTEPSPRPWRIGESASGTMSCIHDANGEHIASCFGIPTEADAALIVAAVNYYKPDLHCDWRELAPEEAAAHCREVAARLGDTPCARDHLKLAAWIDERDRLRDIVKRLLVVRENVFWRKDEKTGLLFESRMIDEEFARNTIEEARAAIGEGSR